MTKATVENKALSRRSFLKGGAVLAAGSVAAPAVIAGGHSKATVLKMQTSWSSSDVFQEMAQQYCDRVEAMSGGRLKIELLPAGAVVKAFQVMDAVNDGVLDVAHTVPVYWYGKNKAASLFGTGPVFGGNANTMMGWFYKGGGQELYQELTQKVMGLNVVGLMGFPMFPQPFGWFKGEVNKASDLNGFKYRTVGLAANLLQKMGMSVAQLPGGEIVPAMERGVIDAFEFNNPTSDRRFGASDVAKNYYLSSYHQASESFEFLFNKDVWDGLAPDLRAILQHGVEAASTANTMHALDQYSRDLDELQTKEGVKVHRTSKDILSGQIAAWDSVIKELEEDPFMKKTMESQKAWVQRVAFFEIMAATDLVTAYNHYFPGKLTL
jgi:TRAP-type mannitol/chloroaromatic compound transport system substrate-binding protein